MLGEKNGKYNKTGTCVEQNGVLRCRHRTQEILQCEAACASTTTTPDTLPSGAKFRFNGRIFTKTRTGDWGRYCTVQTILPKCYELLVGVDRSPKIGQAHAKNRVGGWLQGHLASHAPACAHFGLFWPSCCLLASSSFAIFFFQMYANQFGMCHVKYFLQPRLGWGGWG